MNIVDLHPEDLLDKDARGQLTADERTRLDAHLARCSLCRFEIEARADFQAEIEEHELLSVNRIVALAASAASAASAANAASAVEKNAPPAMTAQNDELVPAEAPAPRMTSSRPTRSRRMTRITLLMAAALLVGGVATAAGAGGVVWNRLSSVWSDAPEVEASSRRGEPSAPAAVPLPVAAAPSAPAFDPGDDSKEPPPAESHEVAPPPAVRAPEPVETAGGLFDAVNDARRQGDYARALTLHRRLQSKYPTSSEAHVSHATVGRLLLDRGDAAAALASFDAYQARGAGALDEAVLVGRATALERLGRADESRAVWRALLAAFPETPYAEHARLRIEGITTR